jgi:hypothetical protein
MAKLTNRKTPEFDSLITDHLGRLLMLLTEVIAQLERVDVLDDLAVPVAVRQPVIEPARWISRSLRR